MMKGMNMKARGLLLLLACLALMGGGMPRQNVFRLSGMVVDTEGRGIGGVVVNDGVGFALTGADGRWALVTDTFRSKFVSISTPAGFRLPQDSGLAAGFFVPVGRAVAGGGWRFVLERRPVAADSFYYVAVSDPQVRNASDMARWRGEAVASLRRTVAALSRSREVVGVALGDLVFDDMGLFDDYAGSVAGMPMTMFQCIGNHDFDRRLPALRHAPEGAPAYAEMAYHRRFGPTDYSFNIGRVHIVTMCNIDYRGGGRYAELLSDSQLRWLERDLSYVPRGSLVILNMHAPGWNREGAAANIDNAPRLERALSGYRVHVFCGHTHFFQNVEAGDSLYQHNIGAASGAWWSGDVNRCGAPNGYMVAAVDGDSISWRYVASDRSADSRMRVWAPGTFAGHEGFVVANVWDYDSRCRVEWMQGGRPMGGMERFVGVDRGPSLRGAGAAAVPTSHLFRCRPRPGGGRVTVVVTDRFGGRSYGEVLADGTVRLWSGRG